MANPNFSKVVHLAGQLSDLNVADGVASNLEVNNLTSQNGWLNAQSVVGGSVVSGLLSPNGYFLTVTGYTPSTFVGAAAGSAVFLNNAPGQGPAGAATDSQLLLLPNGATVVAANAVDGGTAVVGPATLDLGTNTFSLAPAVSANIFTAVATADLNGLGSRVSNVDIDTAGNVANLATAGSLGVDVSTGVAVANTTTGVTVTPIAAPATAGNLKVNVVLFVPL